MGEDEVPSEYPPGHVVRQSPCSTTALRLGIVAWAADSAIGPEEGRAPALTKKSKVEFGSWFTSKFKVLHSTPPHSVMMNKTSEDECI